MSATTESTKKFKVAVVGGGIGGLCLAIGLLKYPHLDVQVYEAAHQFSEVGAGVAFGPNAQRALRLIGENTEQAFLNQATRHVDKKHKHTWFQYRYGYGEHDGEILCVPKNESGQQTVHRAKFLDELVKCVPADICHFSKRLMKVEDNGKEGVVLNFKDETSVIVDCVIGADGIHSAVREFILGPGHPALIPRFSHSVAYRGLIPMEIAKERLGTELAEVSQNHCGPGGVITTYPIDFNKIFNIVVIDSDVKEWEGPWVKQADYSTLEKRFASWGPTSRKIVEMLDNPRTVAWSMWESPGAPTYYKGCVAMCGDAAHATTPFQGQGAAQAIEDSLVLCKIFEKVSELSDIPMAFAAYDRIRRKRAEEIIRTSHEAGEMYAMRLPGVGEDPEAFRKNEEWRMDWIWNRDLQLEVDQSFLIFDELKEQAQGS